MALVEICYMDDSLLVCVKPAGVLSTDEPGGLPELLRNQLGNPKADIRGVHRLDRAVSGLMVLARNHAAASELSRQVREGTFQKIYLAVLHGIPSESSGTLEDLLGRDKARKMTFVAAEPGKDIQAASLSYQVLHHQDASSLVQIQLHTGRTHQIRIQFASRGWPLWGERKYSTRNDPCELALYSHQLGFCHPTTGEPLTFRHTPPSVFPWTTFQELT